MAFFLGDPNSKGGDIAPQMNVTPLVDVALVVLIIFMVVTPLLVKQVRMQLPTDEAAAAPPPEKGDEPIILSVDRDGVIRLGRDALSADEMAQRLPRQLAAS